MSTARATRTSRALPPTSAPTRGRPSNSRSKLPSSNYRLDIYRMGYYDGGRRPQGRDGGASASLPQTQPACLTPGVDRAGSTAATGPSRPLGRCPADAVSGIYFAKLVREDVSSNGSHGPGNMSTTGQPSEPGTAPRRALGRARPGPRRICRSRSVRRRRGTASVPGSERRADQLLDERLPSEEIGRRRPPRTPADPCRGSRRPPRGSAGATLTPA